MFLTGIGTAVPPQRYAQSECWQAVAGSAQIAALAPRSRALLNRVLTSDNGIASRHLALESVAEVFSLDADTLHRRFTLHAPRLASLAAERALHDARCDPHDIDAVVVSTCTGYLCPGLSSYVMERIGLRHDALALDLVGQGCGAALPNLRCAEALLAAHRAQRVLSVCVEVCSAAFYLDDDPGVLVSACLFGDGAGALVLDSAPSQHTRRIEWKQAASITEPGERNALRLELRGGLLRNVLTAPVPGLAADCARRVCDSAFAAAGIAREKIATWIWHAGGRDVLLALQDRLELSFDDLRFSRAVLSEFGNVSSPFVYFVLRAALAAGAPAGLWWMSSFGAGFSCHGALLEVG